MLMDVQEKEQHCMVSFPDPCFAILIILQFKKRILDYRHRPCRLVATIWLAHLQASGPSQPRDPGEVDPPRPPCPCPGPRPW